MKINFKTVLTVSIPLAGMITVCGLVLQDMVAAGVPLVHVYTGIAYGVVAILTVTIAFLAWKRFVPREYDPRVRQAMRWGGLAVLTVGTLFVLALRLMLVNQNGPIHQAVGENVVEDLESQRPAGPMAYKTPRP